MVPGDRSLEEIRADVERYPQRGDKQGLLLALLEVWARHRSPELASAIDALTDRVLRAHPPLDHETQWMALARRRDPCTVGVLLTQGWWRWRLDARILCKRLNELAHFPPDPRIAAFAQELEAEAARTGHLPAVALAQQLRQLHGSPDEAQPDPAVQAIVAAATAARESEEETLLQAVFDAPDDDNPRRVYADWLMERGDSLGRYIAASLDPSAAPALKPEQKRGWCRYLLGDVDKEQVELRRGFPHALRVLGRTAPMPSRWATLQEVHGNTRHLPDAAALAQARTLRALHLLPTPFPQGASLREHLSQLAPIGLRELSLPANDWSADLLEVERWPALQRLGLWVEGLLRLDASFLGALGERPLEIRLYAWRMGSARLVETALLASASCAPGVVHLCAADAPQHGEDGGGMDGVEVSFERSSAFRQMRLSGVDARNVRWLCQILERVAPDRLDGIVVETPQWQNKAFLRRLHGALKPFSSLPLVVRAPE